MLRQDNDQAVKEIGVEIAKEMCEELWLQGVPGLHFYTLNRAELSYAICHMLGLRPIRPKGETA